MTPLQLWKEIGVKNLQDFKNFDYRTDLFEISLPTIILVSAIYFSTFGLDFTFIFLGLFLPISYFTLHHFYFKRILTLTRFYTSWTVSSYLILLVLFEWVTVAFLEVSALENLAMLGLTTTSLLLTLFIRYIDRSSNLDKSCYVVAYNPWIAANITRNCLYQYGVVLICSISALLFGGYLNLTTLCHTYHGAWGILIPDDCSEAYYDINLALAFVSAFYGGALALCLLVSFIYLCSSGYHYSLVPMD